MFLLLHVCRYGFFFYIFDYPECLFTCCTWSSCWHLTHHMTLLWPMFFKLSCHVSRWSGSHAGLVSLAACRWIPFCTPSFSCGRKTPVRSAPPPSWAASTERTSGRACPSPGRRSGCQRAHRDLTTTPLPFAPHTDRPVFVRSCPSWCRAPWRATPWPSSPWQCRRCPWSEPRRQNVEAPSELFTLDNGSLCSRFSGSPLYNFEKNETLAPLGAGTFLCHHQSSGDLSGAGLEPQQEKKKYEIVFLGFLSLQFENKVNTFCEWSWLKKKTIITSKFCN